MARIYDETCAQAAFPLGGIGTGNISLGARGDLRDCEWFNAPGKGNFLPYTFFALRFDDGANAFSRVLEARVPPPYAPSHGFDSSRVMGLPRFKHSKMSVEYPFASIELNDDSLPISAKLTAFTPFIPLNADASGIPCAILTYEITNNSTTPAKASICASMANVSALSGHSAFGYPEFKCATKNELRERGIFYSNDNTDINAMPCGTQALYALNNDVTIKPVWVSGEWFDGIQDLWDDFTLDGALETVSPPPPGSATALMDQPLKVGSVCASATVKPGESRAFTFIIAWHFPYRRASWNQNNAAAPATKNYYATQFSDAWSVIDHLKSNLEHLTAVSRQFSSAFYDSTLPEPVLDAAAANINVLRSTTCFRLPDGSLQAFEGCFDKAGCCDGTCTHVWNYAQTLAFLFPELEVTMRRSEFMLETDDKGKMTFRGHILVGDPKWDFHPAADGQTGTIVRLYREWTLTGNDKIIDEMGENALLALDFAGAYWDADGDNVLDSQQHNTYDIEFYGPNSLTNSMYFAALLAGEKIALYLGQTDRAGSYRAAFESGSARMDEMLWSGEYYIQRIDDVNAMKYQYGIGCLSDQILGQFMAYVTNLGYVLPKDHVRKTLESIYKYNFKPSLSLHENVQRTYALNDEAGLLLCTWPHGGRPRFPFVYCDEVWTGFEYQVAAGMLYEGMIDEGLAIVTAARARHDGIKRNPFNEVECGHHYARSMASWALITALSGQSYDPKRDEMSFAPKLPGDFKCFYSNGKSWGTYSRINGQETTTPVYKS